MIDRVKITLISGKGGDGAICFRHEKSVEMGGPSGGNGGRGGSIYLIGDEGMNSLSAYRFGKTFRAADGENGKAKLCFGKDASDIVLPVPLGTLATTLDGQVIADIVNKGDKVLIAKGGRGGRGNACFKTPLKRTPKIAENGMPGETITLYLELKLIADVGLVGLPNAGKSSFLSQNTRADAQIGDYAFTTLEPQLGVCYLSIDKHFVIADLPGLIEGASEGKGLGLTFLRHVERCEVLLHILDGTQPDLVSNFEKINQEIFKYKESLSLKPMVVAINKIDSVKDKTHIDNFIEMYGDKYKIFPISSLTKKGISPLLQYLYKIVSKSKRNTPATKAEDEYIYRPKGIDDSTIPDYRIVKASDHLYVIEGERVVRTKRLINLKTDEGVDRLLEYLNKIGIDDRLKEAGATTGDTVDLDGFEFDYYE